MAAVSSLNALSQDPQSVSIAAFVRAVVVNGPGVSRIGSAIAVHHSKDALRLGARLLAPDTASLERIPQRLQRARNVLIALRQRGHQLKARGSMV
jgi:hypothetical protein